ncbi:MAG: hypothetical protein KGO93_08070 [Cyanobacteria bacterium REEB446]|nr:hypothetical protein [Cyanobacteria bacterium REEB446]
MVEGNFSKYGAELKRRKGRKSKFNHRLGFIDPCMLMLLAGFSQPLGQWILKYALAEIDDIEKVNYDRLLFSAIMLGIGLLVTTAWYIYSSKRR